MYISSVFVEVDMFYKSVHHFLYQVWRACSILLMLTYFISLYTTSCTRCAVLVMQTFEQNVSDACNIW